MNPFKKYKDRPLVERRKEHAKKGDMATYINAKKGFFTKPALVVSIRKLGRRKYVATIVWTDLSNKKQDVDYFHLIKARKDTAYEYFIKRPIWNLIKPRTK